MMMIHLIRSRATPQQIEEMLQAHEFCIKVAVDLQQGILAGGGYAHVDCEDVLLAEGSRQADIWGATWFPEIGQVQFDSIINILPAQNNPVRGILEAAIRDRMQQLIAQLLEGV